MADSMTFDWLDPPAALAKASTAPWFLSSFSSFTRSIANAGHSLLCPNNWRAAIIARVNSSCRTVTRTCLTRSLNLCRSRWSLKLCRKRAPYCGLPLSLCFPLGSLSVVTHSRWVTSCWGWSVTVRWPVLLVLQTSRCSNPNSFDSTLMQGGHICGILWSFWEEACPSGRDFSSLSSRQALFSAELTFQKTEDCSKALHLTLQKIIPWSLRDWNFARTKHALAYSHSKDSVRS